jgi:dTDP-4-amino-4,6-dideoxygalactose transaminase
VPDPGIGRRVPFFDPTRQVASTRPELVAAVERVLDSGQYVLGREVERLEAELASYLGVAQAVGVASGTDALWLAMKALGVGPGHGVLTTPFTFFATASAIVNTGAMPVFADIDPRSFTVDAEAARAVLEGRIPGGIRALVPVDLYGQAAAMDELSTLAHEHELLVIDDAAQALGAECRGRKVGAWGDAACFSFFPTKNLGGFGDGGLVATNRPEVAERVRLLRAHGARRRYEHEVVGTNSRLDALQAALLRAKLRHLEDWISTTQKVAAAYSGGLADVEELELPQPAIDRTHTYHQYTVRVRGGCRDALRESLGRAGVETNVYYPVPLHLQPALSRLGYRAGDFPEAERASREVLSLPMFPELRPDEVELVIESVHAFFHGV